MKQFHVRLLRNNETSVVDSVSTVSSHCLASLLLYVGMANPNETEADGGNIIILWGRISHVGDIG